MKTEIEKDHAREQAKAQLESIIEMVDELELAGDDEARREDAETAIQQDPLSVLVRSGWHEPGQLAEAEEFEIFLCTGGPAVRIMGELDEHKQPSRAYIQYQDWGTPWTDFFAYKEVDPIPGMAMRKLLTYCQKFYFGE